jgi:hypothetical protein
MNGTNTPKDLASRIKVLELFTLHVLPRNEEWDYAKSVIANSDVLDQERREAFMQTLQELQDVSEQEKLHHPLDEDVFEEAEEEMTQTPLETATGQGPMLQAPSGAQSTNKHQRTSSEVDYGIEKAHPNGLHAGTAATKQDNTAASKNTKEAAPAMTNLPPQPVPPSSNLPQSPPLSASVGRSQMSPPAQTPRRPVRKAKASNQNTMLSQARRLFLALSNLARNIGGTVSRNPAALLRFLLFLFAFIMAFSQRQVRERARRLVDQSWAKIRGTVGMGVKVSYI